MGCSPTNLDWAKLKLDRAKEHIQQFDRLLGEFYRRNPYGLLTEIDTQTGECIFRVQIKESIPIQFSGVIGDVIHNLRSALDVLICDIVRASGKTASANDGFPIYDAPKKFKPGSEGKIKRIPRKAARIVARLKPYKGGLTAFWNLHILDVLDKHNCILVAESASAQVRITLPLIFTPQGGGIGIGNAPPGSQNFSMVPDGFKPVFPLKDNVEIYRCDPGIQNYVQCTIQVAFGKGQVCEGQPVLETLKQYANLVERTIGIFERHTA